jgi:hypothetical protein
MTHAPMGCTINSGLTVTCTGRPDLVIFRFNTSQSLPLIVRPPLNGLISHSSLPPFLSDLALRKLKGQVQILGQLRRTKKSATSLRRPGGLRLPLTDFANRYLRQITLALLKSSHNAQRSVTSCLFVLCTAQQVPSCLPTKPLRSPYLWHLPFIYDSERSL